VRILGSLCAAALFVSIAVPASAQQENGPRTRVTIYKSPERSYLTQGPVARPRSGRDLEATAMYQPAIPGDGIAGFQRYPLPGAWEYPGSR
jgi:hypothetical protein